MHAHRPQNLNVWVKYYVGSEFEVEHIQFLRLDLKIDKQTQTMKTKNNCLVISFQAGGVTTCKVDRIIPLLLPHLPIPTRTCSESVRPLVFGLEAFKRKNPQA